MSDAETVVGRMISALNEHDLDRAMRFFSGDAVGVNPGGQAEGHEQIASYYAACLAAFPDGRLTIWGTVACEDLAIVEGLFTGTHGGPLLMPGGDTLEQTGLGVSVRLGAAFNVENGLIASCRYYFDQLELFTRLGAKLVPGTSEEEERETGTAIGGRRTRRTRPWRSWWRG
ncbi:ester cyclase [Planotetraspora sp. GP83]|uniref:ester cyclase n=1 Tax=Planotetraspora sp. GP83 TaxID=3156264 RepID=UPI003512E14E